MTAATLDIAAGNIDLSVRTETVAADSLREQVERLRSAIGVFSLAVRDGTVRTNRASRLPLLSGAARAPSA
jgi:hypothetical protein